jgi:hypothetical protein
VEVEGIVSVPVDLDVLRVGTKGLQCLRHREWHVLLVGADEYLDLELTTGDQTEVVRFDVLEIDEQEIGAHDDRFFSP